MKDAAALRKRYNDEGGVAMYEGFGTWICQHRECSLCGKTLAANRGARVAAVQKEWSSLDLIPTPTDMDPPGNLCG